MTVAVMNILGSTRGAAMRGAVTTLRSTLMLARQQAVTKREKVFVTFYTAPVHCYTVTNTAGLIGGTNYLPPGVTFQTPLPSPNPIRFTASGSGGSAVNPTVSLTESPGGRSCSLTVYGLTGLIKVQSDWQ
jgi:hypothetical protein